MLLFTILFIIFVVRIYSTYLLIFLNTVFPLSVSLNTLVSDYLVAQRKVFLIVSDSNFILVGPE
jgi:hypothetical protein